MKIIDKETLAKMPNGTVYCVYIPDCLNSWYVITGHNEHGFHSVMPLNPFMNNDGDMIAGTTRITNWCTVDTCDYDYSDYALFVVLSKTEVRAMITVLQYALADCNFNIQKFMDTYYYNDTEIDEKDLEEWSEE